MTRQETGVKNALALIDMLWEHQSLVDPLNYLTTLNETEGRQHTLQPRLI